MTFGKISNWSFLVCILIFLRDSNKSGSNKEEWVQPGYLFFFSLPLNIYNRMYYNAIIEHSSMFSVISHFYSI